MSQIDQAFIQAYSSPQKPANAPDVGDVPVITNHPAATDVSQGPHFQTQFGANPGGPPQATGNQQAFSPDASTAGTAPPPSAQPATHHYSPEPIPAPHIQLASAPTAAPVPVPEASSPATGAAPTTERRPLSTFSAPEPQPTIAFNPVYEVDAFRWPKITDDLLAAHHELLIPVADYLLDVNEQGRSLVGFAGTRPNVGCSTVLLSLARLMGSVGKSVAIVDANFAKASLARDLGMEFETGWEHVLTGELPLAECVVKSINDRMTLLPLAQPHPHANELLSSIQTSVTAGVLRYHYDLVLFNLGDASAAPQDAAAFSVMQHCRLDANLIVADSDRTGIEPIDTLLALFGDTCLGVIGNSAA